MLFSMPENRRILVVTGHYGSGKTEFCVSLAMHLAKNNATRFPRIALCDLDIVNPYFRSRERMDMLKSAGIDVHGGLYGTGTTAEIPELAADIRAPLEDEGCFTILDAGGNDAGARVLKQFKKYLTEDNRYTVAVVNCSRPDTSDCDGALEHIDAIEKELGFPVDAVVNNTHMLLDTDASIIKKGISICSQITSLSGKEFFCTTYPEKLVSREDLSDVAGNILPLGMYMRQSWLDK